MQQKHPETLAGYLPELVGLCYGLLAALAAGTLVTGICSWPIAPTALWFLPAGLGHVGGCLSKNRPLTQARLCWGGALALSMLCSAVGILPTAQAGAIWAIWLMELLICRWACADEDGSMACAITLWVLCLPVSRWMHWDTAHNQLAFRCALFTSLMTLAVLAVRGALRSTRGGKQSKLPAELKRRVIGFTVLLLLVALVLSILPFLRQIASGGLLLLLHGLGTLLGNVDNGVVWLLDAGSTGLQALWQGFSAFLEWLTAWFLTLPFFHWDSGVVSSGVQLPELPWVFFGILMRILLVVIVSSIVWAIFRSQYAADIREKWRKRRFPAKEISDFTQQKQREIDLQKLLQRLRSVAGQHLRPKPRLSDFPDAAGKIRFAFSQWRSRCLEANPSAAAKTPSELEPSIGQGPLIACYNAVRYGNKQAPPEAAEVARQAMEALGKKK